jgi:hypothetical protein
MEWNVKWGRVGPRQKKTRRAAPARLFAALALGNNPPTGTAIKAPLRYEDFFGEFLVVWQGCVWGCRECESTKSYAVKVVRLCEK